MSLNASVKVYDQKTHTQNKYTQHRQGESVQNLVSFLFYLTSHFYCNNNNTHIQTHSPLSLSFSIVTYTHERITFKFYSCLRRLCNNV